MDGFSNFDSAKCLVYLGELGWTELEFGALSGIRAATESPATCRIRSAASSCCGFSSS
jgi:hypothetical protein